MIKSGICPIIRGFGVINSRPPLSGRSIIAAPTSLPGRRYHLFLSCYNGGKSNPWRSDRAGYARFLVAESNMCTGPRECTASDMQRVMRSMREGGQCGLCETAVETCGEAAGRFLGLECGYCVFPNFEFELGRKADKLIEDCGCKLCVGGVFV